MNAHYLAFDLGAESGRAMVGRLGSGMLDLTEVRRFPNRPLNGEGSLRWNVRGMWDEMQHSLDELRNVALASIGVDAWGVDYALLNKRGELVENPYHYRDARTKGMMEAVFEGVPRERIYSITGVQFLPFNTLYQLYAANRLAPATLENATALATIPDLLNYWLTGKLASEYTIATTTQFVDAATRSWATGLLADLKLPTHLLTPIVEPGMVLGFEKRTGTPVVAPACHDTGSAVAAISLNSKSAFLSSGTWSLLGTEMSAPLITPQARDLNFTNEGGVCGSTRLLKNIAGLWLLQSCRACWAAEGSAFTYEELLEAAGGPRGAFRSLFDPDDPAFLKPDHMPSAIAQYCVRTGQPHPASPPQFTRAILESLAFKYRDVLESLEGLTGSRFEEIRVIGGGSKNRLLNQLTADATGRRVIAGPAEATALGNIAMQMLTTEAAPTLAAAREVIERSCALKRFDPRVTPGWDTNYPRFRDYMRYAHT